ncbi:LysM peptidoglycan-binding domain-containing protein [Flavobacterium sp. J49]|uniref:PBP1 and LysM peptidoglycan-binding domain-containing protein n=1 Tax=Flavobacterium sp. J49 TaxID=2718534 RepID=UPI0015949FF6|nr:LysM peptidoglycan-binding domain-containing protein [Flavobacterium sp. J49]MBF6640326.1 LysM peptidoglycan-binding domain-containing protein [Flavobacterium sp. J49]NIC01571.1 LysM peptidoglycan-binding domain-containing protein [Flavobacterium sp. J49]
MKNRIIFSLLFVLIVSFSSSAKQDKYVKHTVAQGETITLIAQKYKVTPFDIYKLNPDSQNGIQLNSVLLIPPSSAEPTVIVPKQTQPKAGSNPTTHLVQPKETLFSLSRQYGVSVEAIKEANGDLLKEGLKIGQTIKIPSVGIASKDTYEKPPLEKPVSAPKETPKVVVKSEPKVETPKANAAYHIIEPKETKYGISKKYGMTIQELERLNPAIVSDFPVGLKLVVSGNAPAVASKPVESAEPIKDKPKDANPNSGKKYLQEYVVKPKETIQSIANDFGITETELIQLNPELKKGIKLGMILRVPMGEKVNIPKKEQGNLMKNLNTNARKQLALLLPFNISKIENDTVNSTQARLKKDKFLNLTLDFYSGALMAIDSAKVLGMNVDIKILDSQETKSSSNVATLVQQNSLASMDAIIGPFYQANVEKLAELVEPTKTPVISPLSKEIGKKFANLYQSMPSLEQMRGSVFQYMKAKGGNIIAVIDAKKGSVKQYIQEMQSDTKLVGLSAKGSFVADSLRVHLQKDKMNYVLLASESTGMILAMTNAMLAAQKDYQVQLVIMEPNETLDFEEISLTRLTKLKLLYPSLSRPNETIEANQFDAKYKKFNKIIPNQYAIRGFDVTFDALLRLSQEKTFEETIQTDASEQIENKFDYTQNTSYGYSNNGIYILYYDTDLTIKEAL